MVLKVLVLLLGKDGDFENSNHENFENKHHIRSAVGNLSWELCELSPLEVKLNVRLG